MKTLTLFRACYFANGMVGDYKVKRMASLSANTFIYRTKQMDKRIRQRNKFFHAVYERLQEQEDELEFLYTEVSTYQGLALSAEEHISQQDEELEMLRNYAGETTVLLNAHGWDLEEWFAKYEKEKTNE